MTLVCYDANNDEFSNCMNDMKIKMTKKAKTIMVNTTMIRNYNNNRRCGF